MSLRHTDLQLQQQKPNVTDGPASKEITDLKMQNISSIKFKPLPNKLTRATTKLSATNHKTLLRKQTWLRKYQVVIPKDIPINDVPNAQRAIEATFVFAQEVAGTAVCIAPQGLLLTCSHCIAESPEGFDAEKTHWLLSASGKAVAVRCIRWDPKRDLALLRITSSQGPTSTYQFIPLSHTSAKKLTSLVCVGHPGSEDLEVSQPGVWTHYDVLHLSIGLFRGHAKGQNLQDNAEIGAMMHDCWTYWGHSGAGLVEMGSGELAGLHSSWDEVTRMRRGVPVEAVREFLGECSVSM